MPVQNISESSMITFRMTQDLTGELYLMSFKTGRRSPGDWGTLLAAADTAFHNNVTALISKSHHIGTVYSEWGTSGFVGYHAKASTISNQACNSGAMLPPQNAVVVSLLNTVENFSVKRRRGRIFHGPIPVSFLTADGKLNQTNADAIRDAWRAVGAALAPVNTALNDVDTVEICVASEAEGKIMPATKIGVGLAVDTQRRRRRHEVEGIAYITA